MDREEALFHAALEIEDPAQRAAYLEGACQGDPALRERLETLGERNDFEDEGRERRRGRSMPPDSSSSSSSCSSSSFDG